MNVRLRPAIFIGVCVLAISTSARAQLLPAIPEPEKTRVRLGPLLLNPSLSVSDVGVDNNVFNDADSQNPQTDLALTIVPQTDIWMRMGRTWLSGNVRQDLVWFHQYSDERSVNGLYRAGWVVPLTRLSLMVDGSWLLAKERPGYEIDARVDRRDWMASTAAEVRALSRTYFGGRVERRDTNFGNASFLEEFLQKRLDRTRTTVAATARHELTPMTSVVTEVSAFHDRFDVSPDRDADSLEARGGVRFDPAALIKGSVQLGYRRFSPASPDVPDYRGLTAAASLSYVALAATRVTLDVVRDVEYSFETIQPYYVMSGILASITQRIHGPFDVQGRGGVRALAYRNRLNLPSELPDRRDRVTAAGGGVGYRLGRDIHIEFDIEQQRRTSIIDLRNYAGLRYGMSVTYGLN